MIAAGFDIGTRFVKVCIVDGECPLGFAVEEAGRDMRRIIGRAWDTALDRSGVKKRDVKRRVATGYGLGLVKTADSFLPEAPCLARAVHTIDPEIGLALDVGGLFINAVGVGGRGFVDGVLTNDKCAAGSGKFLEMVSETLSVPFASISDMAFASASPYAINSQCAVFAESEIISQVNGGREGSDIIAGVLRSIVSRAAALIERSDAAGIVALCGGIAAVPAFRVMFQDMIKNETRVLSMEPQIITAYGAALLAGGRASCGRDVSARGYDSGRNRVAL
ncbi:MAG TPA: acyl-CoA dehydratase activase [Spirochaetota bacterium]|nr:acyl-CoA dehydratase activase [Spirochaetota bacterium]HPI88500.1 acyl-CoA dehydratase activase [Spirochaetota bacterium]HPR47980.1 acyl-CoA dehydratase activase [Spirochaetota bacterium]